MLCFYGGYIVGLISKVIVNNDSQEWPVIGALAATLSWVWLISIFSFNWCWFSTFLDWGSWCWKKRLDYCVFFGSITSTIIRRGVYGGEPLGLQFVFQTFGALLVRFSFSFGFSGSIGWSFELLHVYFLGWVSEVELVGC